MTEFDLDVAAEEVYRETAEERERGDKGTRGQEKEMERELPSECAAAMGRQHLSWAGGFT